MGKRGRAGRGLSEPPRRTDELAAFFPSRYFPRTAGQTWEAAESRIGTFSEERRGSLAECQRLRQDSNE